MKYEFDAVRWARNWSARKRFFLADGRDPFALVADEIVRLKADLADAEWRVSVALGQIETVQGELAAMKAAARVLISDIDNHMYCESVDGSKDALARLVGEE